MRITKNDTIRMRMPKYENYAYALEHKFILDKNLTDEEFRVLCFILSSVKYKEINLEFLSSKLEREYSEIEAVARSLICKQYLEVDES